MKLTIELRENSYDIIIEKGIISSAEKYFNLNRNVLIVTDINVPQCFSEAIKEKSKNGIILTLPDGEQYKSFDSLQLLLKTMLDNGFSRKDCIVAVGGGVIGDLSGFAAACYMRGIDFYNVPTTVLSQVDSSIGGKVAINFNDVKNSIGAFHQPKCVLIDIETLESLPSRQIKNGLIEALKSGAIKDPELFTMFEQGIKKENITDIIIRSLTVKKNVVENDEKEQGERMLLNFGHTIGHGIEIASNGSLYHGEAVALGMYLISNTEIQERLDKIYSSMGIKDKIFGEYKKILKSSATRIKEAVVHDKKADSGSCNIVTLEDIGKAKISKTKTSKILDLIR